MKIYIMEKRGPLFSVVLRGYFSPCIGQVTSKGGRKLNVDVARGRDSSERMMERVPAEATEVEKTSAL